MRKPESSNPIIEAANAESIETTNSMAMPAGLPRKSLKPTGEDDPTGALGPRKSVPIPPDAKWISAKQVLARYGGRSLMWLKRKLEKDPKFPRPTFFGPLRHWRPAELDAYDDYIIERSISEHTSRAAVKEKQERTAA